jgi:hypothetical protein
MFTAIETYLGEKVVSEKEYLSAMLGLLLPDFWFWNQAGCVICGVPLVIVEGWSGRRFLGVW